MRWKAASTLWLYLLRHSWHRDKEECVRPVGASMSEPLSKPFVEKDSFKRTPTQKIRVRFELPGVVGVGLFV